MSFYVLSFIFVVN